MDINIPIFYRKTEDNKLSDLSKGKKLIRTRARIKTQEYLVSHSCIQTTSLLLNILQVKISKLLDLVNEKLFILGADSNL